MAHTHGPWKRFDTPDYAEIHPKGGCLPSPIALVGKPDDADLIAAAPDLLEALKASNDKLRSVVFDGDDHPLVAANNAAIAKATGSRS